MMSRPTTITVWRNNRLDAEETLNLADLAAGFAASSYAAEPMPLERAVSLYLATDQHATWEDKEAFDTLCDIIAGNHG